MNPIEESTPGPGGFRPTRWTLVLRARGKSAEARAALAELCEAYYAPVYAFIMRSSRNFDDARDLTQEFFARMLAGQRLDNVDPCRGRFRSFLLGAVKHFLADQYDRNNAAKRGGGQVQQALESGSQAGTTVQLQVPDPAGPPPDTAFDQEWARTLISRCLDFLAAEFAEGGNTAQFDALKPWLLGQVDSLSQADAAKRLGVSEGAAKVAIHRLRKRFRELVKAEIAHTVPGKDEVQDELRYLVEVLSS